MSWSLRSVAARHAAAGANGGLALQSVDLDLADGECVAVIGPSGAGKTSLLQVMALAMLPCAGEVRIDGENPWMGPRRRLKQHRSRIFLAPQVPPLPPRQRVVTSVLAGRLPALSAWASLKAWVHPDDLPAAHAALARFDLADKLFERVDRLSGGERQRVGLARALLAPAGFWLLDEPLSSLDPARARQALSSLLGLAHERAVGLVASLHQVDMALAHFPRIVGLRDGRIAFDLPVQEVDAARLEALYAQREHGWDADRQPLPEPAIQPAAALGMPCR